MRTRLRLPRTAAAAAGRLRDLLAQRAGTGGPARVLPARAARPARAVPADRLVRARHPARQGRRALERALRGALAVLALTLTGCGGDDEPAPSTRAGVTTTSATPEPKPPAFLVGAHDDAVREPGPTLDQLRHAGFGAVGITSFWQPGLSAPAAGELAVLQDVAERASG